MGRRKLDMKPIEDKHKKQVAFSKRRGGLFKKSQQLSVLCDVDVAVIVFSSGGKLYEYCNGHTDSMEHILSRYHKSCLQEERSTQKGTSKDMEINYPCSRFRTCKELLQSVKRLDEDPNELSVTDMTKLEEELNSALMHTRSRKTQLAMEHISTIQEQDKKLTQENERLKQQVASAKQKDKVDDGGGLHDASTNSNNTNPSPLLTLALFPE